MNQMPFKSNNQQLTSQFPIYSTIQLNHQLKSSKNNLYFFLNVVLKTQSGKVKLASIKKNINSISFSGQKEQEKLLNRHDKNARIIFQLFFDEFNLNKNKNQQSKVTTQKGNVFSFKSNKASGIQNYYRISSRRNLKSQKSQNRVYNNIWQRLSSQNQIRARLSPQITNLRLLQTKKQQSNQSQKTSRLSKTYNQQYKQLYQQTKDRMQIIQKKYIKSQQKIITLQQQIKQLKQDKEKVQERNKNLEIQIKQKKQLLDLERKQGKKIKSALTQTQREKFFILEHQNTQIEKLQYRETLLREKLKINADSLYKFNHLKQNLQNQITKLKKEIIKKNVKLTQNQKKIQEIQKTEKEELKKIKIKYKEIQFQNSKLKKIVEDLNDNKQKYQQQREKRKQLQNIIQKTQKFKEHSKKQKNDSEKKINQLTDQLKKQDSLISKLQSQISIVEKQRSKDKQMQERSQIQMKRKQKQFQERFESQNAIIQEKLFEIQELKNQIKNQQQQNARLKSQIQILKQMVQDLQTKSKGKMLKQSTRLDQLQSQKIIKFNLVQLSQYEKVQLQNTQLKKEIKKLQKTINQKKEETSQISKNSEKSQTYIRIQNLRQSVSLPSVETKQKLFKLAESTFLNQKTKQFQIQKNNLAKKYEERQKEIVQQSKQLHQKCNKMSKMINQNKETIQDKQLIITSFKINLMKGIQYLDDIDKLINSIQKNQKLSPNNLLLIRQTIKKLQAIISKVPKGVEIQCQQNNFPAIKLTKPKSKKQISKKQRQQSPNKSKLYLKPDNLDKDSATIRSQVLLNISKSIFLNDSDSFRSCAQESVKNQDQSFKSNVNKILQDN